MLERPPLRAEKAHMRWHRRTGARAILTWLSGFPGGSWQERWEASPASACPRQWRREAETWVNTAADVQGTNVQAGLLALAAADVIRLSLPWQMDLKSCHVRTLVEESRDPEGFARLKELAGAERWASASGGRARRALVRIMVAKGGSLSDITVGDVLEYDAELPVESAAAALSTTRGCASWAICRPTPRPPCGSWRGLRANSPVPSSSTATRSPPARFGL
ncbi:hypothetical protein [Streptomyces sp. NPDC059753]|uniref:hypothetical protein n=1 Tax=Streptomyces sp. NPDC059753 TaxID=3346933 RepID=UPI003659F4F0